MTAPSLTELTLLAERAAGMLPGEGQVTVTWALGGPARAVCTVVEAGRAGRAETTELDDEHLRRAARAAALHARQARAWPAPPPPEPALGREHDGFDFSVLALQAPDPRDGLALEWFPSATRSAVASTSGVRSAEQRSRVVARVRGERDGRVASVSVAAVGAPEVAQAAAEVQALLGEGEAPGPFAVSVPAGRAMSPGEREPAVVLGPEAVATVLGLLRSAFGVDLALGATPLAGRRGTRVAAPAVNLSDCARHSGTLPRSYDDEGVPRRPVSLIRDGVLDRGVHDTASAAKAGATSTGHSTRALALAPLAENLVLAGGAVADVPGLCADLAAGLFIPALEREGSGLVTSGAAVIAGGAIRGASGPLAVEVDPLAVLASVQALTSAQRLVAFAGDGGAVVPALRAGSGVRRCR